MAKSVTSTIAYSLSGDGFSGPIFNLATVNGTGIAPGSITLAAGANTVTVPATAVGVTIVPPAGSANAKTLKGIAGDTGILLNPAVPTSLAFTAAGVATFVINSAGTETVALLWQ